jgi:hypothetical protein
MKNQNKKNSLQLFERKNSSNEKEKRKKKNPAKLKIAFFFSNL